MIRVLCVGSAVVDFLFAFDELPELAKKYFAQSAEIVGGGIAANAAVAIARLGGDAILGAQLGNDAVGDLLLQDLQREGVDISNVTRTDGARSSYSSVYMNMSGERQIANYRGENLRIDCDWFGELDGLGAVLVDTRITSAAVAALEMARQKGIPGIVDGEEPIDPEILHAASHAAFSLQGIKSLYPDQYPREAVRKAARDYQLWACVTDGQNGVWHSDGEQVSFVPAFTVEVIDTLAAGDVWHGAFALALAEMQSEDQAVKFANAVGALKCTKFGGRSGTPTRAELNNFLKGRKS